MQFQRINIALIALALVLGGCAGEEAAPITETAALPVVAPERTVSDLSNGATIPPLADEGFNAAPAEIARTAPAVKVPAVASLAGWNEGRITSLLGAPHFRRVDAPAELWQYRVNGCVLDLFLYPAPGGALAVDHLETRVLRSSPKSGAPDPQGCFAAIVRAAAGLSG